jgi:iron complex transport system substrate-binding protein
VKLSMTPQPKNGLPLALTVAVAAVALIAVSFAGFAGTADAKKKPQRIVALSPFTANTIADLGKVRQLVAVGEVLSEDRGSNANYSPVIQNRQANNKTKTLTLRHPNGPNLEQLAKLRPDIVFTSPTWAKGKSAIRQLGIKVVEAEPMNLGSIYGKTRAIARKIRVKPKKANALVRQDKKQVRKAINKPGIKERPEVMVVLGVGRTPFTFLSNSWGGHIVRKAGGTLLTGGASAAGGFARISDEVVIAEQPEVIIAVPHATKGDIPELKEFMTSNPAWSSTPAVENKRLYVSTDNSLLQANSNPARVIRKVRRAYLKN